MRIYEMNMLNDTLKIFNDGFYIKNDKKVNIRLSKEELSKSEVLLPEQVGYICNDSDIKEVDEIKDLAYVINSNKANINEVKQAFKELFKRNTNEIFKTNPNIWKQFDRVDGTGKINSLKNFKDLVEDISFDAKHPIFNFIKAE